MKASRIQVFKLSNFSTFKSCEPLQWWWWWNFGTFTIEVPHVLIIMMMMMIMTMIALKLHTFKASFFKIFEFSRIQAFEPSKHYMCTLQTFKCLWMADDAYASYWSNRPASFQAFKLSCLRTCVMIMVITSNLHILKPSYFHTKPSDCKAFAPSNFCFPTFTPLKSLPTNFRELFLTSFVNQKNKFLKLPV